jgi:hypothetical protein
VMPEMRPGPVLGPLDLLIVAGYLGAFFLVAARALASAPLVPINDPCFVESLSHKQ